MKRAVIIASHGFEDAELIYPYYRLQEAGFETDIASKDKGQIKGKWGYPVDAKIVVGDLNEEDYDLVVIPGGHESPDRVRQMKEVLGFIKDMNSKGKIISAVCHGLGCSFLQG